MTDGKWDGGDGGIRTLDTLLGYAHLANECLQPLGHVSGWRFLTFSVGKVNAAGWGPAVVWGRPRAR